MNNNPILNRRTNDDGSHSHWEVVNSEGEILFTEDVENCFMDKHHAKSCYLIPHPSEPTQSAREEVMGFSVIMEQKLKENDHKDHWSGLDPDTLLEKLEVEVLELASDLPGRNRLNPERIQRECADIANYAMMIADNVKKLTYSTPQPPAPISEGYIKTEAEKLLKKKIGAFAMNLAQSEVVDLMVTTAKWIRDKALTAKGEPKLEDYVFEDHPELVGNPKEYDMDRYNKDCKEFQEAQESQSGQHKGKGWYKVNEGDICYKTKEPCKHNCQGLCKESA